MLCLEEPMKNKESGPVCWRISFIFAVISSSAWSQPMRWYLPSTSFIGYLSRYSPWPCSRNAAPLAQCAPIFRGESNTGSWRIHTPFCTTASTAQPTEQWPHTVRRTTIPVLPSPAAFLSSAASALRSSVNCPAARPAPTPMPERLRKLRRSMVGMAPARLAASRWESRPELAPADSGRLARPSARRADAPCAARLRVKIMSHLRNGRLGSVRLQAARQTTPPWQLHQRGPVILADVVGDPVTLAVRRRIGGFRQGCSLARHGGCARAQRCRTGGGGHNSGAREKRAAPDPVWLLSHVGAPRLSKPDGCAVMRCYAYSRINWQERP
ncbi:hypothetical protein CBM2589_B220060 [Cupriavidus taiwanensis]|uniref:Uncharacterized protein n=1 Tax=Cupriavidus taiwanensis TaxID=164546 RepID=A0A375BNQ1_9BURK|nr:hypothetical protein CBM2589_B220060 [Cupriavidus taiwanensis]